MHENLLENHNKKHPNKNKRINKNPLKNNK